MGDSRELVKLYYRIGEVSQIVGVQPHVLRYWETEFKTIRPQKSHKGQRVYSRKDVEKLIRVKDLLKNQGFTIAGAKKKLREPEPAREADPALAPIQVALAPAPAPAAVAPAPAPTALAPAPAREAPPAPKPRVAPDLEVRVAPLAAVVAELRTQPVAAAATSAAAPAPRNPSWESRERVRDALLALREEIATMLDDLDSSPRRPKLPARP